VSESLPARSTAELLALVDAGWERLLRAADGPGARESQGGDWSGTDALSHARLYDAWLLGVLDPSRREEQAPYRSYLTEQAELDARNRLHLERDRALPAEEVRSRAERTHAELRRALGGVPEQRLSVWHTVAHETFVPGPDGRSLAYLIAIETFWHYRDHAEALERLTPPASP
jgi:hypothetical protein